MLDLDVGDLDAPGVGLLVEDVLDVGVQLVALGQHLVELVLAEHRAQRGLRQLAGRLQIVLDLDDRPLRVDHAEVEHGVDLHRDVVARDHVLARTSITTMRRSTRTICWMTGIRITRPGPLTFQKRPSLNTTPRSYSRRIFASTRARTATSSGERRPPTPRRACRSPRWSYRRGVGLHVEDQAVDGRRPARDRPAPAAGAVRAASSRHAPAPALALGAFDQLARGAHQCLAPRDDGPPARARRHAEHQDEKRGGDQRGAAISGSGIPKPGVSLSNRITEPMMNAAMPPSPSTPSPDEGLGDDEARCPAASAPAPA